MGVKMKFISILKRIKSMGNSQKLSCILKISYDTNNNILEKKLTEFGIDISKITCIGCEKYLNIKDISGLHKRADVFIFFCNNFDCQLTATHKLLELEG